MFRSINDVIAYFKGDWSRQNDLMDFYTSQAQTIEKDLIRRHPDIEEDLRKYSNCVMACSSLSGARLGMKEVEHIIDELEI